MAETNGLLNRRTGRSGTEGSNPSVSATQSGLADLTQISAVNPRGFGHYHETYTKLDTGWRIRTSRLIRLRAFTPSTF